MRTRIALDAEIHALAQPVLVLGMEGGAAADGIEHRAHAVVVLDQQRAGGGAHEHLHRRQHAGQHFQFAEVLGVLARGTDIESEIAMHAVMAARDFVGEGIGRGRGGSVFGISNTAVTPPSTAPREPVSRSSLWVRPGSRKCTWLSMTPGQQVQTLAVDGLARRGPRQVADRRELAGADAEIARALAVVVDDGAALEDQVVGVCH